MEAKMPKVYLAGKISKNDWRHELVPGLRNHAWGDGDLDCGKFIYTGPFFVGCDHGCFHGPDTHGSHADGCIGGGVDGPSSWTEVVQRCRRGVISADLLIVYAESLDCIGSMVELGIAIEGGIPVIFCVAPGVNHREFHFPAIFPNVDFRSGVTVGELKRILDTTVAERLVAKGWKNP
jgi:hypothetical protein